MIKLTEQKKIFQRSENNNGACISFSFKRNDEMNNTYCLSEHTLSYMKTIIYLVIMREMSRKYET